MLANSQLTLSQAHMLYACIMYTKLHIACMYCINSEQLLLVMFVKKVFYCIIYLVCMLYVLQSFILKSCMQMYRMYTIYILS